MESKTKEEEEGGVLKNLHYHDLDRSFEGLKSSSLLFETLDLSLTSSCGL